MSHVLILFLLEAKVKDPTAYLNMKHTSLFFYSKTSQKIAVIAAIEKTVAVATIQLFAIFINKLLVQNFSLYQA